MKGFDYGRGEEFEGRMPGEGAEAAVVCAQGEVRDLMGVFGWDESTVIECTNLDETVRYTSYDGYDFVSLIYAEAGDGAELFQEINIFFGGKYLVAAFPEQAGTRLTKLRDEVWSAILASSGRRTPLAYVYYHILSGVAADFTDALETLEDDMELLAEAIEAGPDKSHSQRINGMRRAAYVYKKLSRAMSYIGEQITLDENKLITGEHSKYFRNIDTRLQKLYGFADNLYDFSNELLHSYESKLSAQTNEMVNKLTVITLFFGPMTVIAGIYGMNFDNMPELRWAFGYPAVIGLMALVCVIIYIMLKRNKWL